jgi:hypothetical protein
VKHCYENQSGYAWHSVQLEKQSHMTDKTPSTPENDAGILAARPELTAAAQRALAEAEERRKRAAEAEKAAAPSEIGGRGGLDPIRYGDWEKAGLTSDF